MTNQTSPFVGGNEPRTGFWARLTPVQRVGMILAVLVLPCCGGAALISAVFGDDKPKNADTAAAAEQIAGERAATPATTEQAGDQPAAATSEPETVPTSAAAQAPVVTKKRVTQSKTIGFTTRTVKDSTLPKGETEVRTKGVAGVRTITYEVTLTDGKETSRKQISSVVTRKPVTKVIAVGTKTTGGGGTCDPNYSGACVPVADDVDCAGGSGNGPAYVRGPVRVVGSDIYDLDRDGDGIACDS
nr:G5 domain-containing protein [uncultured Actinoplanes sp.]